MYGSDKYCPKCGTSLECPSCWGTGKKKTFTLDLGTFCCGMMRPSDYCPSCGRLLKQPAWMRDDTCSTCLGNGRTAHFCI